MGSQFLNLRSQERATCCCRQAAAAAAAAAIDNLERRDRCTICSQVEVTKQRRIDSTI